MRTSGEPHPERQSHGWTRNPCSESVPMAISSCLTRTSEKETVKVNSSTVRTTTRTFVRNADGVKTLFQVTEEEKLTSPEGSSKTRAHDFEHRSERGASTGAARCSGN